MTSRKDLEALSAAMDGEADELELRRVLDAAAEDPELQGTWKRFHATSAVMRGEWRSGSDALRERVWQQLESADTADAAADTVADGLDADPLRTRRQFEGFAYLVGFVLSIPTANWMIGNVGLNCGADGPCLIPVAPGIMAPSSVLVVGLTFVLRDLVQRRLGVNWAIGAILAGAALSAFVAPASLVLASAAAFLFSELADLAVYTPLQRRRLVLAVLASSFVGLVIDSMLFLGLAFGSLEYLAGQVIGKSWMVVLVLPLIALLRRRDERLGMQPA